MFGDKLAILVGELQMSSWDTHEPVSWSPSPCTPNYMERWRAENKLMSK